MVNYSEHDSKYGYLCKLQIYDYSEYDNEYGYLYIKQDLNILDMILSMDIYTCCRLLIFQSMITSRNTTYKYCT